MKVALMVKRPTTWYREHGPTEDSLPFVIVLILVDDVLSFLLEFVARGASV
jgi:hypothetical protein